MAEPRPPLWRILWRGWRRFCPHCGKSPIFERWFTTHPRCNTCGLVFEQSPGDSWAFWLIGDRVFIALLMVALFFIFKPDRWSEGLALLIATLIPLIWTMPHRLGVCIGLDYLSRYYLGQPGEIPDRDQGD